MSVTDLTEKTIPLLLVRNKRMKGLMSTNICVCEEAITLHLYLTEKVFSPFHLPKHLC